MYEISREPLNGFASNSHERRVWSFARTNLKVKVLSAACVRFMCGKTSLASSFDCFSLILHFVPSLLITDRYLLTAHMRGRKSRKTGDDPQNLEWGGALMPIVYSEFIIFHNFKHQNTPVQAKNSFFRRWA